MSDKLTPDGQGGFHLPEGGRLTPDGMGGYHVIGSGAGLSGGEMLLGMIVLGVPILGIVNTIGFLIWLCKRNLPVGLLAVVGIIALCFISIQLVGIIVYMVGFICLPLVFMS